MRVGLHYAFVWQTNYILEYGLMALVIVVFSYFGLLARFGK